MNLLSQISEINQKMSNSGINLKIEQRGKRLNLRGKLPSQENNKIFKTQRISLGLKADREGIIEAEKSIQLISLQLEHEKFRWDDWLSFGEKKKKVKESNLQDQLKSFEANFFSQKVSNAGLSSTKTTWESSYVPYLRRLSKLFDDGDFKNLQDLFLKTLLSYKEGSRSRKQCGTSISVFANYLKEDLPNSWRNHANGYGLKKANFRNLPTDKDIEQLWTEIPNKSWQLVFGLMATYGLRNHEVFFCDLSSLTKNSDKVIRVYPTTKTGEHQSWPFHPEWVEKFELYKLSSNKMLLPKINLDLNKTSLQKIGKRIGEQFRRYKLSITPYHLRHAWAIRTIHYGLPDSVSARMMGHSVSIHTQNYHHWITKRDHQKAVNKALNSFNKKI
tara:strand:+ start:546 stop:1709 length:1164 start_codon:yes stop_codon:yes gene_type:complete